MRSLYDAISFAKTLAPVSDPGSGALTGGAVDTKGFSTAVLKFETGLISGTPDATSIAVKLQESDASGSGFADALDNTGVAIGFTVTAASTVALARIEGLGVQRKRYLKAIVTTTFTAGSSPKVLVQAEIILGRGYQQPANTGASNT